MEKTLDWRKAKSKGSCEPDPELLDIGVGLFCLVRASPVGSNRPMQRFISEERWSGFDGSTNFVESLLRRRKRS